MTARYGNFTRGSQLIEAFSMMFAAGLKPMLWVTGTLFSVSLGFLIWHDMTSADLYRCTMRGYAFAWEYFKLDPMKPVSVIGPKNLPVILPVGDVADYAPVRASWRMLVNVITAALQFTVIIALPVCLLYTWAANWLGRRVLKRNHERGATIAPLHELTEQIKAHNDGKRREERAGQYRQIFGPTWWLKAPLMTRKDRDLLDLYEPYTIAGVPYPWRTEQTHMFSMGTTGTGKSTMMRDLLNQVRQRGRKAVVFDLTGTFIEAFYDRDRDIILNPFDERCPQWSVFHDCQTRAEFVSAAEALIPSDGGGAEPFWVQAARLLFVEGCMALAKRGDTTNAALYNHLMTATLKLLNEMVGNSVASPLTNPAAARMAESIRATMNTNINAIQCLPDKGEYFSIKDWVLDEKPGGSILFIAARHVDLSTVKVLLTLWMDMSINAMMAGPPSPRDVRIWYLFDELGALHRLPAIEKGMQTARNYGGAFVLGVHTIAKLRDTYGDKIAETLGSLARTKLILATADYSSAQWCSQQIGNGEWSEMEQGVSFGVSNVRDAITLTNQRKLEPLVLPDDIQKLPDLNGWLVLPQGFPAARVKLKIRNWPKRAHSFIGNPDLNQPIKVIPGQAGGGGSGGNLTGDESGYGHAAKHLELVRKMAAEVSATTPQDGLAVPTGQLTTLAQPVTIEGTLVAGAVGVDSSGKLGAAPGQSAQGQRAPGTASKPQQGAGSNPPDQLKLPVQFDPDRTSEITPDNAATQSVGQENAAAFRIKAANDQPLPPGERGVRQASEDSTPSAMVQQGRKDEASDAPEPGQQSSNAITADASLLPGGAPPLSANTTPVDLTKLEAQQNFGTGRDDPEPEQDMEFDR